MLVNEAMKLSETQAIEVALDPYTSWTPATFVKYLGNSDFMIKCFGHHHIVRPVQIQRAGKI